MTIKKQPNFDWSPFAMAGQKWAVYLLPTFVAIAVFVVIAFLIPGLAPLPPSNEALSREFFVPLAYFIPKPVERTIFVAGILFFPLFFVGWYSVIKTRAKRPNVDLSYPTSIAVACLLMLASIVAVLSIGDGFFYWTLNACLRHTSYGLAVLAMAVVTALLWGRPVTVPLGKVLSYVVPILFCVGSCLIGIFGFGDKYLSYPDGHFEVMFFSIVRTYLGAPLLADCGNQYGLYPIFLLPLFRLIGLSVTNYSIVMSLLVVFTMLCFAETCRRIIKSRWIWLGTWSVMIVFSFVSLKAYIFTFVRHGKIEDFALDPYFQGVPLRTVFPAIVFVLAATFLHRRHRGWLWLGHFVLASGIFWNIDAGFVAWGAWVLFLSHLALSEGSSASQAWLTVGRHWLAALSALALVFTAFQTIYYLSYGTSPHWELFTEYQRIFAMSGYFMLPLPYPHSWGIAIIVYLLGLAVSLAALFGGVKGERAGFYSFVFLISVFGIGIFSYFEGRSHLWCFPFVSYPAWLLFGIFLDRHVSLLRSRGIGVILTLFFGSWVLTAVEAGELLWPQAQERLEAQFEPVDSSSEADIAFLRAETTKSAHPLILSFNASKYHLALGSAPPFCPSFSELIRRRDFKRLIDTLEVTNEPIFIDRIFLITIGQQPHLLPLIQFLSGHFVITSSSSSANISRILRVK